MAKVYNTKSKRQNGVKSSNGTIKERGGYHSSPSTLRNHPADTLRKDSRGSILESIEDEVTEGSKSENEKKKRILKKGQDEQCIIT